MENVPRLIASLATLSKEYSCAVKIRPSQNSKDTGKQKPSVLLTGKYLDMYSDDDVLLIQLLYHFSLCSTSSQIPQQNHALFGTFSTKWAIWAPSYLGYRLFCKRLFTVSFSPCRNICIPSSKPEMRCAFVFRTLTSQILIPLVYLTDVPSRSAYELRVTNYNH
jgi:hypothetical protein